MTHVTGRHIPADARLAIGILAATLPASLVCAQPAEEPERGIFGWRAEPIDEPLVTDRPDFTESTDAVPMGRVQLEAGYTFTYDREAGTRTRDHGAPELLFRIGVARDVEIRIGWDGYAWTDELTHERNDVGRVISRDDWTQGSADMALGVKVKLFEQDGLRPHLGLLGQISVPSGSSNTSSGDVDPAVSLLWAYDLSDRVSVGGNINVAVPTENSHRFVQAGASLAVGVALTERWGSYAEYFGLYPDADGADCSHSINGGLTYLVNDNLQFDVRVGAGLNEQADDFFAGAGFAWRF